MGSNSVKERPSMTSGSKVQVVSQPRILGGTTGTAL